MLSENGCIINQDTPIYTNLIILKYNDNVSTPKQLFLPKSGRLKYFNSSLQF